MSSSNGPDAPISEAAAQAAGELWVVMPRLKRRLAALDEGADSLSPAESSVLRRLAKEGPATASELAAAERVRPQSMAATVAALEAEGLVLRSPDPHDGRRRQVTLTEAGRRLRLDDSRAREAWLARALDRHADPEQLAALRTAVALLDEVAGS